MGQLHIPNGFAQVTMHGVCGDADGEVDNVFGVDVSEILTDFDTLASVIYNAWMNDFGDFFHEGYTLARVVVAEAIGGQVGESNGTENGTVSGGAAPMNVAALAKKVTGLSGKRNHGRIYFGCLPEAYTVGSNLEASGVTQLQAGCDAFISDLQSSDSPMVILHTSLATPTPVSALTVETRLATQRGRLRD